MNALRFGVFITPSSDQPDAVVELAVLADQVGLDLVTFQDHPYSRSCSTPGRCCPTWPGGRTGSGSLRTCSISRCGRPR
jgi:alkanesulfonate monooxygenase SsuD/methylene tetrahydromethanopterin reductase-like flavin-dependent oxidoreductase (luciferase family)